VLVHRGALRNARTGNAAHGGNAALGNTDRPRPRQRGPRRRRRSEQRRQDDRERQPAADVAGPNPTDLRHLHLSPSDRLRAGRYRLRGRCPRERDPGVARNAVCEQLDYGRRYRSNQVQRSFENTAVNQQALEVVMGA
jgi:hypothetical protein